MVYQQKGTSLWKSLKVMNKKLAILGAGGHGKVVADAAELTNDWDEIVFFDDNYPEKSSNSKWPVVGKTESLLNANKEFNGVIVAIGDNFQRLNKMNELEQAGASVVSIVHPSAMISSSATLAPGCVVFAGAVINADAVIGRGCIINSASVVEHDCQLQESVHICPNASLAGNVAVGARSWIGIGSVVKDSISIGCDVTVGAGAVVVNSISSGEMAVGNPAKIRK